MSKFKIGASYRVWGIVEVEAETLEQAIDWAKSNKFDIELPTNAEYIDDSFEIDDDIELAENLQ